VDLLRSKLARGGVAASSASILAALTATPAEAAPVSLRDSIEDILKGTLDAPAVPDMISGAGLSSLLSWKSAITGGLAVLVAIVLVAVMARSRSDQGGGRPAALPAVPPAVPAVLAAKAAPMDCYWNFDSPELPRDIRLIAGRWHHVDAGGVEGSGCMETEDPLTVFLIDVPVGQLPILVSYRVSPILGPVSLDVGSLSRIYWSEQNSGAQFNGLSVRYGVDFPPGQTFSGQWLTRQEYVTDRFIYRWHDKGPCEFAVFDRPASARLLLGLKGTQRIDELRIRAIRPEDVPDASLYLNVLAGIPPAKRQGAIRLAELKPGRPGGMVVLQFTGPYSFVKIPTPAGE
jgi:hypothetical protein